VDILIKKSGVVFSKLDSQVAAVLCAAFPEQIEKYVPPAPEPAKAQWTVGTNHFGDKIWLWLVTPLGERVPYNGDPDKAEDFYSRNYKNCTPIPRNVIELYRARVPLSPEKAEAAREEYRHDLARQQAAQQEQNGGARWKYPSNM
jgi:hypothetical protein